LICLTLNEETADKLNLKPMVQDNQARFGTAFTVSIEARHGITTGISAADRATTNSGCRKSESAAGRFGQSRTCISYSCKNGGVLVRTGQTEGSVDLCRLAGLLPAGVICEIMKDDGTMARMPDLEVLPGIII